MTNQFEILDKQQMNGIKAGNDGFISSYAGGSDDTINNDFSLGFTGIIDPLDHGGGLVDPTPGGYLDLG